MNRQLITSRIRSIGARVADHMMVAQAPDENPQARGKMPPAPPDRHWFVPDESGHYCAACNLPERNRRHSADRAA